MSTNKFYKNKDVLQAPKELRELLLDPRVQSIEHNPGADLYVYKLWLDHGHQVDGEQHCIDADDLESLKDQMKHIRACKCESCLEGLA